MKFSPPKSALLFLLICSALPSPGEDRQFVVEWPQPKPAASVPAPNIPWLLRVEANLDKLRDGPYDLIFDGDSITDNFQTGGAEVWKQNYGNLKALDIGIGGDQVQHLIWRLQHGSLAGQDPKLIVVMIGTNNTGSAKAEDIAAGIETLVKEYETRAPSAHILLLGIFPRGFTPSDPGRVAVNAVNAILAETKFDPRVSYLNFGKDFLQPDGTMLQTMMGDGLHPGAEGYAIWAKAIQPYVEKYVTSVKPAAPYTPVALAALPTSPRKVTFNYPIAPPPAGTPQTQWPAARNDWGNNFEANIDKLKDGPYDLVLDGDQMAMAVAYQPAWKDYFIPLKALDLGTYWDQVQNVTWRVENGSLAGQDPKLIILQIGIYNSEQPAAEVATGIRKLLDAYEKACPHAHILLVGLFPRNPSLTDPIRTYIANVNKILATFEGPKVTYLDIGSQFLKPDGTISTALMPDNRDLSPAGYELWVKAMQPVIDKYLGTAPAK